MVKVKNTGEASVYLVEKKEEKRIDQFLTRSLLIRSID